MRTKAATTETDRLQPSVPAFDVAGTRCIYDSAVSYGYRIGFADGERYARMSDESFTEAVARRARVLEHTEGEVSATIRAIITGRRWAT